MNPTDFKTARDAAAEHYTDVELCGKSIDEQHAFDAFNKGANWARQHTLQGDVVKGLVEALAWAVKSMNPPFEWEPFVKANAALKAYEQEVSGCGN